MTGDTIVDFTEIQYMFVFNVVSFSFSSSASGC